MPFNSGILRKLREQYGMNRSEFAAALGLSYGGLYKYETGVREPSRAFVEKIASLLGLPVNVFFAEKAEELDSYGKIPNLLELTNRLNKERFEKKTQAHRIAELEKQNEHLMSILELQTRHVEVLRLDLPKSERAKKLARLARETASSGEIRFDEIAETLRIDRATLRRWLASKKIMYECRLFTEKTVEAYTPDEAGIRLQCFDCESKADEDCNGYGNTGSPGDFFAIIALYEANGINDREEQARLLHDTYDMELTAHQISEYLSRQKNGKPVPADIINLQPYKRR